MSWSPFEHRRETVEEFRARLLYVIDGPKERELVADPRTPEALLDFIGSKYKLRRREVAEVDDAERERRSKA